MMFIAWLPLALLYLKRTIVTKRWRDALLAGFFIALIGWTRWQLLIMASLIIALYVLYLLYAGQKEARRTPLKHLIVAGLFALLLLLPIGIPVAVSQLTRSNPEELFIDEPAEMQPDLLAYLVPSRLHPLHDSGLYGIYKPVSDNFTARSQERTPFIGYAVLLLLLLGAFTHWRKAWFWVLLALVLILLALGPQLRIKGQIIEQVPMPYNLVADVFFVRIMRAPDRFNVFLALPLGLLAAFGVETILARVRSAQWKWAVTSLLGIIILAEYMPVPFPQSDPSVPQWLVELAQEPDQFAIVELPNDLYDANKKYMYYQVTHGKPLVNGKIARVPSEALAFWNEVPLLKILEQDSKENLEVIELPDVTHQLQLLAKANVRYLILDKAFLNPGQQALLQDWLTISAYHEDEDLLVYRTEPQAGVDFRLAQMLTGSLGVVRTAFAPAEAVQGGVIKADIRWGTTAALGEDAPTEACLYLSSSSGQATDSHCKPIAPAWPPARWGADEVVRDFYIMPVAASTPPGDYTLNLALARGQTDTSVGEPAGLGAVTIHPFDPDTVTDAQWDADITLPGYDLQQTGDALTVTLYWQATGSVSASYKVFVHLINPDTGDVVAQSDHVPRDWTYPTNIWERGEVVRDSVILSLAAVPPRTYELWLGLYDPLTGTRLAVRAATTNDAGNALYLETIEQQGE
jgi:hypothetical protein